MYRIVVSSNVRTLVAQLSAEQDFWMTVQGAKSLSISIAVVTNQDHKLMHSVSSVSLGIAVSWIYPIADSTDYYVHIYNYI